MSELQVGDAAPDFTLASSGGEDVTLSALRGQTVVLYFYPRDNTPGCTTQSCEFRDLRPSFEEKGAVIFGISKDSLASHDKFIGKYDLNFPLLSDPDLAVHKAFGAYGEKMMYGKKKLGVKRSSVVIGPDGTVVSVKNNVRAKGNAERTLALL